MSFLTLLLIILSFPCLQGHPSWQRVLTTPILWRPPYIAYPPLLSQILSSLPPIIHKHPHPLPHRSFCCLVSLIEWVIAPHAVLLFTKYHWPMHIFYLFYAAYLMQQDVSLLWSNTWHGFFASALIWYQKHTKTQSTNRDYIVCTPFLLGVGGDELPTTFSKRGGLTGPQFWEGVAGK